MSEAWLAGRGAVVTGGGRGIGAAVARALSAAGAAVVVSSRTEAEVKSVAAALSAGGAKALAARCDVTSEAEVKRLGVEALMFMGAVDILVNNAGVSGSAPLAKMTLADWNRMLSVNATGTFLCTREFVPAMVTRGWGRVINVASVAGLEGARYVAHYSAAKHAVIGFTRSVAAEVAGTGVSVNAVCPGYVDTPMTEETLANVEARAGLDRERALAAVLATAGQTRLITADEVAAAVLELCRAGAPNGEAVVVNPAVRAS